MPISYFRFSCVIFLGTYFCRASLAEAESIEREIEQPGQGQAYRPPPRTKEIQVNNMIKVNTQTDLILGLLKFRGIR